MKTGKRFLSVILVVVMLLTAAPLAGFVGLKIGTMVNAADFKAGDHVLFGTYPQARITDENLIDELNTVSKTWEVNPYYTGDGYDNGTGFHVCNAMKISDFFYNSQKYRAVLFDKYRPWSIHRREDAGEDDSNQDDNGYFLNTVYYFKYEPLTWRVLDPSSGYLLCETIIDAQPFNNEEYSDSYVDDAFYHDYYGIEYYSNNYAKSSIRQWLNSEFYNSAFSAEQKANILETQLNNDAFSPDYSKYNSEITNDKVFLMSWADALNPSYGFSSSAVSTFNTDTAKQAKGTDYALCQGLGKCSDSINLGYGYSSWYLRTAGGTGNGCGACCLVTIYGDVSHQCSCSPVDGVRPVCRVSNLANLPGDTPVESISLNKNTTDHPLILAFGSCEPLVATITPINATSQTIVWTSSDPTVATVDQNGVVTAGREGIALITAQIEKKKAECKVIVRGYNSGVYSLGEETYSFRNFGEGGNCFGMAVTSSMYQLGLLDKAQLGGKNKALYDYSCSGEVKERIIYYQGLQGSYCREAFVAGCLLDRKNPGPLILELNNLFHSGFSLVEREWAQVFNYVKSHKYDGKGSLTIDLKLTVVDGEEIKKGMQHSIAFLRYGVAEGGQECIFAYDSDFPDNEICFYRNPNGSIHSPYNNVPVIESIGLEDTNKYFNAIKRYRVSRVVYANEGRVIVENANESFMSGDIGDSPRQVMYELPDDVTQVRIAPLVDEAEFTYMDQTYHIHREDENTIGVLTLAETEDGTGTLTVINDPDHHVHIYTAELTSEPTCTEIGKVTCTCTRCDDTYTVKIDALGHYDNDDDNLCDDCGEPMPQEHTHTYTSAVTTKATCTEPGVKTYTCTCGKSYTETIEPLGHVDKNNDGKCDRCKEKMTGKDVCPYCGKVHKGFFQKIVGFFHKIFYRIKNLFGKKQTKETTTTAPASTTAPAKTK